MKKIILLLVTVLFSQLLVNAQGKYNLEIHSGTNFIYVPNRALQSDLGFKLKKIPGFQLGAIIERKLNNHFSIGVGAGIGIQNFGINDMPEYYNNAETDTLALFDYLDKENSFQIPIFIKYSPLQEKIVNPYIKIGITNTILYKVRTEYTNFRIVKEGLSEWDIYYYNFYFTEMMTPIEFNFSEIEYNRYSFTVFSSIGLYTNINKKLFAGLDVSFQTPPMTIFSGYLAGYAYINIFVGLNF